MNARVGLGLLAFGLAACGIAAGCTNSSTSSTPTPVPSSSASFSPDTLWVQDATSRTVRAYKGASTANGGQFTSAELSTNDNARPDIVYDPASNTMWYPNQTNNSLDIWTAASTHATAAPATITVVSPNTINLEGAAVFDSAHNLLIVAHNTNNTVDVYSMATSMTSASVPAGHVTLNMTDAGLVGTPRPQEMFYDPIRDILFVADQGTICAKFPGFGTAAGALSGGTTIAMASSSEITALSIGSSTGLAYNSALDDLWITEYTSPPQITQVKTASTWNTSVSHLVSLTNFTQPSGLTYDAVRDILFVYDSGVVLVFPNGSTASGAQGSWPNRRVMFDFTTTLSGFGLYVDTTH
jgi:hypothetical protein